MKYKVGDIVKLRDDLKNNVIGNKPIVIDMICKDGTYQIWDDNGFDWYLIDEMIEGLWEERKPKLKLIDILNKIANGELKEGTKVKVEGRNEVFILRTRDEYGTELDFFDEDNYSLLRDYWLINKLNKEVELIEPHQFREDTKMIETTDNTKIEELDKEEMLCLTLQCAIAVLTDRLNEVIRYMNKEDNNE